MHKYLYSRKCCATSSVKICIECLVCRNVQAGYLYLKREWFTPLIYFNSFQLFQKKTSFQKCFLNRNENNYVFYLFSCWTLKFIYISVSFQFASWKSNIATQECRLHFSTGGHADIHLIDPHSKLAIITILWEFFIMRHPLHPRPLNNPNGNTSPWQISPFTPVRLLKRYKELQISWRGKSPTVSNFSSGL